jgi:hypothetical protein
LANFRTIAFSSPWARVVADWEWGCEVTIEEDTLHAFYDLNVSHLSFDFLAFLAAAETARRQRDLAALHMVIVPPDREQRPVLFFSGEHETWPA